MSNELSLKQREQKEQYLAELPIPPRRYTAEEIEAIREDLKHLDACDTDRMVLDRISRDVDAMRLEVDNIRRDYGRRIEVLQGELRGRECQLADAQKENGALRNGAPLVAQEADQVFRPCSASREFDTDRIWLIRRPTFIHVDRKGQMSELPPEFARHVLSKGLWTHETKPFSPPGASCDSDTPRISETTLNSESS